ncbi:MAG TPA: nucleotidyltransferase family protein [Ignavibacteria bacterium]|nr:nucleotidyltransferase family protein [Ignavibacteria bacterium]
MDLNTIKETLKKNKKVISEKFGVKEIAIFGSYVSGEQNSSSDIDIHVTLEEGRTTFDNYMDLRFFLEDLLGAKVDLLINNSIRTELRDIVKKSFVYV